MGGRLAGFLADRTLGGIVSIYTLRQASYTLRQASLPGDTTAGAVCRMILRNRVASQLLIAW